MSNILTGPGKVLLTWTNAECNEGINHYRVYLNDEIIANTLDSYNSYTVLDLPLYTLLSFYVVGVSNDLRITEPSNVATITLPTAEEEYYLDLNLNAYLT